MTLITEGVHVTSHDASPALIVEGSYEAAYDRQTIGEERGRKSSVLVTRTAAVRDRIDPASGESWTEVWTPEAGWRRGTQMEVAAQHV